MFFDLFEYGILKVSGPDASKLLQGQLSCHVEKLTGTDSTMGAHCNPQGRVISLFYLFCYHQAYYLIMPRTMITIAQNALKKYALFYKVELSETTDEFTIIGVKDENTQAFTDSIRIHIPNDSHRYILAIHNSLKQHLPDTIERHEAWKKLNIYAHIPDIYPDTSGYFLPHDLDLPALGAVDFSKGCYTGQEIIARMHYRGKLKNHLYHAKSALCPIPGTLIYTADDTAVKIAGSIVDVCEEIDQHSYDILLVADKISAKNRITLDQRQIIPITIIDN